MFVAVDQEVGAAFGPFASNEEGVLWVRDRLLDAAVINLDDEVAAMAAGRDSIPAIQEDLMSMSWFVYEVEFVEDWPPEEPEPADWPLSRLYGDVEMAHRLDDIVGPDGGNLVALHEDEEPKGDNPWDSAYAGGSHSSPPNL